jgi:nitroimidazol reductase NimA-like FMN-containing flavoprotein (pyridoxamine 5'-phosphate oxidase superfamily)
MMDKQAILKKIAGLLTGQKFGVLATLGKDYPYGSMVAFSNSRDMKQILFATKRATSKYKNLKDRPQVSIFIDNRSNQEADLESAIGLTALGDARELSGKEHGKRGKVFLLKHPYLRDFLTASDCALFLIKVRAYYVVLNFQEVHEVIMT